MTPRGRGEARDAEASTTTTTRSTTSEGKTGKTTTTTTTTTTKGTSARGADVAGARVAAARAVGSFSVKKGGAGARATTTNANSKANADGVFSMDQLKAAMDRGVEHFSSEVEKAISAKKISFAQNFPLGRGAREEDGFERAGGREGDAASHRADRKKTLSISTITEMARRASQDSLAKLDDARFMERLRRPRRKSEGVATRDEGDDGESSQQGRATSAQDLQALIVKSMPKAPTLPKWGEEWDVFKAINMNMKKDQQAMATTTTTTSPPKSPNKRRSINRRRAISETIASTSTTPSTSAPTTPGRAKDLPPLPPSSNDKPLGGQLSPKRMSPSTSTDALDDLVTSQPSTPKENENMFDSFKKGISERFPRPISLPNALSDFQNAVRRITGQPEDVMTVSSPHDASVSSNSSVTTTRLPRAESKELADFMRDAQAKEKQERSGGGAAMKGKDAPRSVREPGRSVAIVTTATLPWMTGTAVNPLLRAAYLARRGLHKVTLVIPFLAPNEQALVHPNMIFNTPEEQGEYVKKWVKERCGFEPDLNLSFYPGRYATDKYSIIPVGDLTSYIPGDRESDIAVLEEPEHLNWYHAGERWTDKFNHVVGIVHTNYLDYVRLEENGEVKEKALKFINNVVSRVHCHKIIKLSDAVQEFPKSTTMNVHGVSPIFLDVGEKKAKEAKAKKETAAKGEKGKKPLASIGRSTSNAKLAEKPVFTKGAYFLGKVVWGKGYKELLDRVSEHNSSESGKECPLEMDVFGNGEDLDAVQSNSKKLNLPLNFQGRKDHAAPDIHDYKVFVNPSLSDVVATTTAEAFAMGKFVVCAKHPSNEFFSTFPNCLIYDNPEEFSSCVKKALTSDPTPLSTADSYRLSWEAATDRFLDAAELGPEHANLSLREKASEKFAHALHTTATKFEPVRRASGAGTNTLKAPEKLDGSWVPEPWEAPPRQK